MAVRLSGTEIRTWLPKALIMGATAYVISNDAPTLVKFFGRICRQLGLNVWVCDGVDDQVEIQAAITALPNGDGRVVLSEGTFNITGTIYPRVGSTYVSWVTFEGQGYGTRLLFGGTLANYALSGGAESGIVIAYQYYLILRNMSLEIVADFPDYPQGLVVINMESTAQWILLENLRLVNNSASGAGNIGIFGRGSHVTVRNVLGFYFFRGLNTSTNAKDWLIVDCEFRATNINVPWTLTGFEFEDGCEDIRCVDCYVEDLDEHTVGVPYYAIAFVGGWHAGKPENYNIQFIRPHAIDCDKAFSFTHVDGLVIEQPVITDTVSPFYQVPSTTVSKVKTSRQAISAKLDLSGGATDVEVWYATSDALLIGYEIYYTEASSADAGVAVRVGRYRDGVALDDDYFDITTSEPSKGLGYKALILASNLTQTVIAAGDVVTVGTVGGKVGTGEVVLTLLIIEAG